ncbi:MAG: hypothetical protein Kow00121_16710 [Elainellaceae cyanobacterium]
MPDVPVDWLNPVAFETTGAAIAAEPTLQFSTIDSSIATEIVEKQPETNAVALQFWTDDAAQYEWQISNRVVLHAAPQTVEDETSQVDADAAVISHPVSSLSESESEQPTSTLEDLSQAQFTPSTASVVIEDSIIPAASSETQVQFISITLSELEQMTHEHWQIAPLQIAQTEPLPESDTPQTVPEAEESSPSPRWRFSFMPYAFVPLSVSGSATVRNFTADLDLGLSDILDPLNFALAGRAEAWRGNLGLIFDGAYFNLGQDISTSLSVPNCLCNIFPSEIDTEVNVKYGQFDLGVGYRLGANVSNAATEFDMGPLVVDAIIGMRIYTFQQEIDISTNVGTDRNLESSTTLIQPLVSGRFRWNASRNFAGWVRGDFAGFGIGGTLFAASVTGGIDWMFSGNTSLQLAYRFSSLRYNTDVRGQDLGLNLVLHGPYMGVVFRF